MIDLENGKLALYELLNAPTQAWILETFYIR